ncbi:hypothetical protein F5Y06DRAFT_268312 [Hypoxylon sp. FL0890]|nr:hypothetical protein F5Y06DRAFT_268312 [Hypoxylon sp. FL0890]
MQSSWTFANSQANYRSLSQVDHPYARGTVAINGNFICGEGGCNHRRPIANVQKNITSHLSKFHRVNSQHSLKSRYEPRCCGLCPGTRASSTFHALVTHVRRNHGYTGGTEVLRLQYPTTRFGDMIRIPLRQCDGRTRAAHARAHRHARARRQARAQAQAQAQTQAPSAQQV